MWISRNSTNRTTPLLLDQSFTETVSVLGRCITFSCITFPAVFLMVGLMGFLISWLMINGRRMEFAIMRGLGDSRKRVFASFFLKAGPVASQRLRETSVPLAQEEEKGVDLQINAL